MTIQTKSTLSVILKTALDGQDSVQQLKLFEVLYEYNQMFGDSGGEPTRERLIHKVSGQ